MIIIQKGEKVIKKIFILSHLVDSSCSVWHWNDIFHKYVNTYNIWKFSKHIKIISWLWGWEIEKRLIRALSRHDRKTNFYDTSLYFLSSYLITVPRMSQGIFEIGKFKDSHPLAYWWETVHLHVSKLHQSILKQLRSSQASEDSFWYGKFWAI